MFFLSNRVEVPENHIKRDSAVITRDISGRPFDWQQVLRGQFQVKVKKLRPRDAAVAVRYRGHWFYIEDCDHESKVIFFLLQKIYALQAQVGGAQALPVLTLPIGG